MAKPPSESQDQVSCCLDQTNLGFVFLKSFHTLNCFSPYSPQSPKLGFIVSSVNLVREYLCKGPFFVFEEFIVAAKKLNIN